VAEWGGLGGNVNFVRNVRIHFIKHRAISNLEIAFEEVFRNPLDNRSNHSLCAVFEDMFVFILQDLIFRETAFGLLLREGRKLSASSMSSVEPR
jgi:hypothetical protein